MNRRALAKVAAAAAVSSFAMTRTASAVPFTKRGKAYFTDAVLTTHDEQRVRFYTDLLQGKRVLINFVFVGCTDICDSVTANLAMLQDLLGDRVGRDIFMYSITLQPEFDTPSVLRTYAERFGVKPGWSFLTGAPADVELLRRRLGFADIDPARDANIFEHAGMLRIGEERLDRWAMAAALLPSESLAGAVNRVIPPPSPG